MYRSFLVIGTKLSFQQIGIKENYLDLGVLLSLPRRGRQLLNSAKVYPKNTTCNSWKIILLNTMIWAFHDYFSLHWKKPHKHILGCRRVMGGLSFLYLRVCRELEMIYFTKRILHASWMIRKIEYGKAAFTIFFSKRVSKTANLRRAEHAVVQPAPISVLKFASIYILCWPPSRRNESQSALRLLVL